jgi:amino acid transporter
LLFILLSYFSYLAFPEHNFTDRNTGALDVMMHVGGSPLKAFFLAAFLSGSLGSALVSQAAVVRVLYAMGRDGVIVKSVFGSLNKRFNTPVTAILIVSALSLISLWIELSHLSELVSFGALMAFLMVNLSVIKHYYVGKEDLDRKKKINYLVLPLVGAGLVLWLWTTLSGGIWITGMFWLSMGVIYLGCITGGFMKRAPMLDLQE